MIEKLQILFKKFLSTLTNIIVLYEKHILFIRTIYYTQNRKSEKFF